MATSVSGMAASIRAATESEQFDLGNTSLQTISNTIRSAFQEPLPLSDMIRITFVTGAGKQARQKYDEGAARAVTAALRELGYTDDRTASCMVECAGCFKLQHDTGKNLKTVVVFPKIVGNHGADGADDEPEEPPLFEEKSPEMLIAMSSLPVFQRMLEVKCPSWSQKKGCLAALGSLRDLVKQFDDRLMSGTHLSDPEQDFYDSSVMLQDKEAYVKTVMHAHVEASGGPSITKYEKDFLLEHNAERLATLQKEMATAKGNKMAKLQTMEAKARQRKELLAAIEPVKPHKLRYETEINKLRKELVPLLKMEQETRGRLNSIKEVQILGRKEEIEVEIEQLEARSRGWFEDDAVFDSRLDASRAAYVVRVKQRRARKAAVGGVSIGASTTTRVSKWLLPGETMAKPNSRTRGKKKKSKSSGGVFSAMVIDSSSEEEENADDDVLMVEDDDSADDEKVVVDDEDDIIRKATEEIAKKKKTRKKKKKKKTKHANETEDQFLARQLANTADALATSKKGSGAEVAKHPALEFLQMYLMPVLLILFELASGLLLWVITRLFGKSKKKRS